jgi:hypothetical protein
MGLGSQNAETFLSAASGEQSAHFHGYLVNKFITVKPINLFLASADTLFGLITTVRANGQVMKKIPWSAFYLSDEDWQCVRDVKDILVVCLFAWDAA